MHLSTSNPKISEIDACVTERDYSGYQSSLLKFLDYFYFSKELNSRGGMRSLLF